MGEKHLRHLRFVIVRKETAVPSTPLRSGRDDSIGDANDTASAFATLVIPIEASRHSEMHSRGICVYLPRQECSTCDPSPQHFDIPSTSDILLTCSFTDITVIPIIMPWRACQRSFLSRIPKHHQDSANQTARRCAQHPRAFSCPSTLLHYKERKQHDNSNIHGN